MKSTDCQFKGLSVAPHICIHWIRPEIGDFHDNEPPITQFMPFCRLTDKPCPSEGRKGEEKAP